jgi:hypothetical protein
VVENSPKRTLPTVKITNIESQRVFSCLFSPCLGQNLTSTCRDITGGTCKLRYGSKIGKNSDNVKNILYGVKKSIKKAINHYIWFMAFIVKANPSVSEYDFSPIFGEIGIEPDLGTQGYIDTDCSVRLMRIPYFFEAWSVSFPAANRPAIVSQDSERLYIR